MKVRDADKLIEKDGVYVLAKAGLNEDGVPVPGPAAEAEYVVV